MAGPYTMANAAKQQLYNMARERQGKHGTLGNAAALGKNVAVKTKKLPMAASLMIFIQHSRRRRA
ncbi:hypothetical protein BA896_001590 [Janthinobacterium lividum]|uniref:Uncharacterized protein n=1 Tax=Janthinobacterium lividum TaxID=29581 RepID=A0A1E8PNU5_9BURK|nr:hypothetical protein BA896_001590 [Janthinobacterium lividum]